jgi:hypothetical protein
MRLYIDDKPAASHPWNGPVISAGNPLALGNTAGGGVNTESFAGVIKEFKAYRLDYETAP